MNYFEIKPDGQAFIRTDSGTIIRKVGNGEYVNHAEFNSDESLFVITYNSGRCELDSPLYLRINLASLFGFLYDVVGHHLAQGERVE